MRVCTHARTDRIPDHSLCSMLGRALMLGVLAIVLPMPTPAQAVTIRVLLLQDLPAFSLSVPPGYTVLTQPAGLLPTEANHWRGVPAPSGARNIPLPGHGIQGDEVRPLPP